MYTYCLSYMKNYNAHDKEWSVTELQVDVHLWIFTEHTYDVQSKIRP